LTLSTLVDWGLLYAEQGWKVFPCKPNQKIPATRNGFKDASRDPTQIKQWFDRHPDQNIAAATGFESGMIALDIDKKVTDGFGSLQSWEADHGALPATLTSRTPSGGEHRIFRYPNGPRISCRTAVRPGLDFRGDDGYIVVPPSRINGAEYEWVVDEEPAEAPPSLIELITRAGHNGARLNHRLITGGVVPQGERNDLTFRYACTLRRSRVPYDDALKLVLEFAATRCQPPLEPEEAGRCLDSAYRYPEGSFGFDLTDVGNAKRLALLSEKHTKQSKAVKSEVREKAGADEQPLDDVRSFIAQFVAFPNVMCLDTVTLWAAHAHMVEHFHTTPRLAALSPEPESGKTRLLELLELLTPNSMLIFSPSVAAIFRKLAVEQSTLLFDEVDTIFTKRGKDDQNEDLRALLNAGYRKGASIPRCVGPKHEVSMFAVFAATALAGIGDLPGTIMTRAIVIRMRRRSGAEPIEPFRLRVHQDEGHALRYRLAAWAKSVGKAAGEAWPKLPADVIDRRAEAWEPLIAIADAAGGTWPERARVAAVADVADLRRREPTLGIRLLMDLRTVFGNRDVVSTDELLKALNSLDESPWVDLRGKPLDSRGLAMLVKRYGVASKNVRTGKSIMKGYGRSELHEAWIRYLPSPSYPLGAATSATSATDSAEFDL